MASLNEKLHSLAKRSSMTPIVLMAPRLPTPPRSPTPSDDVDHREYAWMWEICPWTDKQIQLFSNLPLDIVQLVFEKTMEDEPRPLHLLLVCQQTRRWLEPLIYRHVSLEDGSRFKKFYQTFRDRRQSPTKDSAFFQRNVRTFFMCVNNYRAEKIAAIVRDLTGLHCLACWDTQWGRTAVNVVLDSAIVRDGEDIFPYKDLRRLSFSATLLVERGFTFMHRAFRDLTHMDIYFNPIANWESLRFVQHLTHLSVDLVTDLPQPISTELLYWFRRILDACPPSVKIVIFGIVDDFNADFDLIDSEGDYLPPGWPPRDPGLDVEGWADWPVSDAHCPDSVDFDILHPIAQLAFGKVDPRAVAAAVTDNLPLNQLFRNLLLYFVWPNNKLDWDWTVPNHRDCWTVAEDIVEKRKGLTYAKLVSQMLQPL